MGRHHANNHRVPGGAPNISDNQRKVYIGHREIGGKVAAWAFTINRRANPIGAVSGLLKLGFNKDQNIPHVSRHWCVIVGDFHHQLQSTGLSITSTDYNYYDNERHSVMDLWDKYEVGTTSYNDVAIEAAGESHCGCPHSQ